MDSKNVEKHAAFGGTRLVFRTLKFAPDPIFCSSFERRSQSIFQTYASGFFT